MFNLNIVCILSFFFSIYLNFATGADHGEPDLIDISNATTSNPVQLLCSNATEKEYIWQYMPTGVDIPDKVTGSNNTYPISSSGQTGFYKCKIDETVIKTFEAINFSNPFIVPTGKSIIFTVGDVNQTIECLSYTYPSPDFSWTVAFSNDEIVSLDETDSKIYSIKNGGNSSVLTISKVNEESRGTYYCTARNLVSSKSASVYLRIHGKFVALWPFLGIVCETLLVIAITLVVRKKAANNSKDIPFQNSMESSDEEDEVEVRK